MALLGKAALAMWWDMAPHMRGEFEDWHTHEHFPERLAIPGFRRATRWADAAGGPGFFVMYELEAWETFASPDYLARLNAPTPWSAKLMPYHSGMTRCQTRVVHSRGGGVARHALTLKLSAQPGREGELREHLGGLLRQLVQRPGISGAHLLQTHTPDLPATTEQKIRGGSDRVADWVFIACGYDASALEALQADELGAEALAQGGGRPDGAAGLYALSLTMIPADLA